MKSIRPLSSRRFSIAFRMACIMNAAAPRLREALCVSQAPARCLSFQVSRPRGASFSHPPRTPRWGLVANHFSEQSRNDLCRCSPQDREADIADGRAGMFSARTGVRAKTDIPQLFRTLTQSAQRILRGFVPLFGSKSVVLDSVSHRLRYALSILGDFSECKLSVIVILIFL